MVDSNSHRKIRIHITDRNYSGWQFLDIETNQEISTEDIPLLTKINPVDEKLFSRDVFTLSSIVENSVKLTRLCSPTRTTPSIAGVLMLENNKTFGRTENKKRLLYKCIPDDKHMPSFLVPYEVKLGFSKVNKNKYVVFKFEHWEEKHPRGMLVETVGDVDNLDAFYEYQLYCKSLHISLTDFTNNTRKVLNQKTNAEYIEQIFKNPNFQIEDRRDRYVFTIDPQNSLDYDDGFSVESLDNGSYKVSVYIANVFVWLETLGLWNSFSKRVATIYLPDRRRPMLPTILSDMLCSLQENQPRFALAMDFIVTADGKLDTSVDVGYKNVLIRVHKNYSYEDAKMMNTDNHYKLFFDISTRMDKSIRNSHDIVAYWMILMNTYSAVTMMNCKAGIFRSAVFLNHYPRADTQREHLKEDTYRILQLWNNTIGRYIHYSEDAEMQHELIHLRSFKSDMDTNRCTKSYIHITSPIRRLIDLLNQMILFRETSMVKKISADAEHFIASWLGQMDYINTVMRSIRKIQTDCELLNRCVRSPEIMTQEHDAVVFDKIVKNDGSIVYTVYMENLKMIGRTITHLLLENYSYVKIRVFLFEDEDKVKKKIRLQILEKTE
jgi:exoribonuclease R